MKKLFNSVRNTNIPVFLSIMLLLIATMQASASMQNDPTITNSVNGYLEEYYGPPLPIPPSPPVSEYIVTATDLTDDLVITASTSYSWPDSWGNIFVSLSPTTGFANQIIIPFTNGNISTTIYVKTGAQFIPGDCYGTIIQTSTGASDDIIDVYIASYLYVYSPVNYIGQVLECPGSVINLPLTTEGFNNVGGFEYNIDYDPTVLTFLSLENSNPALPCIYEDCEDPEPSGYIISSVTNINPSLSRLNIALVDEIDGSWSVPDSDKLFDLSFYYTGGFSGLVFNDVSYYYSETAGVPYTVIDEPYSLYYHNGSVGPANNTPTININPDALSFGDVLVGIHSAVQTYTITGCNLTAPVTVTAPTGFSISETEYYPWKQTLTLSQGGGNLNSTIYVRFNPLVSTEYSGNITNESTGATTQTVAVSGTGIENNNPYIFIEPETLTIYSDFLSTCGPTHSYNVYGGNLTEALSIYDDYNSTAELSLTGGNDFTSTLTILPQDGVVDALIFVRTCPFDNWNVETFINNSSSGVSEHLFVETRLAMTNAPVTTIGNVTAQPGTLVYVPVTVSGFTNINQVYYTIEFNPNVLSFQDMDDAWYITSVVQVNSTLSQLNIASIYPIDWCVSFPDGYQLFNLPFLYNTGTSALTFGDCSFNSYWPGVFNDEPHSLYYLNGSVGPVDNTPTVVISTDALSFGEVLVGTHSEVQTYTITGCNLTAPVTVTAPSGFAIYNADSYYNWLQTMELPYTGGTLNATVAVCFKPSEATAYSLSITNESSGANTENITVTGTGLVNNNPYIIVEPEALLIYTDFLNECHPIMSYYLLACNLTENLHIDSDWAEVSLTGEDDFTATLDLVPVNGIVETTVYVRLCYMDYNSNYAAVVNSSSGVYEYVQVHPIPIQGNAPVSTIGQVTASPGALVNVPVTVTNFINMNSVNYIIEFDPNILVFQNLENSYSSFLAWTEYSLVQVNPTLSQLIITAEYPHDWAVTYPDCVLFDMVFLYNAGTSSLNFGNCSFYNLWTGLLNDEPHSLYYHNGSVGPVKKRIQFDVALEGLYNPSKGDMNQAFGRDFPDAIADEITIGLAQSTFPYSILFEIDSVLLERSGHCQAEIPENFNGDYYIVITHRNSIETWSKMPVTFHQDTVTYNFTDDISKAYNNNLILKGVKYYIFAGDVNQDGIIDTGDMTPVDNDGSGYVTGYVATDVNGDGNIDTGDMTFVDNNSSSYIVAQHPFSSNPVVLTSDITNITYTTAVCGGEVIEQGSSPVISYGVCWSTSPNPTIDADQHTNDGSGTGTFISNLTGLDPSTTYFVRAYAINNEGTTYGEESGFTTISFNCGSVFTVQHFEGTVAPVDKIVNYGTVYTDLTGQDKCWITQNLGADHQATSVDDDTEASAGWYWQFNRKQGYKHDGITRTPNTPWITPVIENFDWQPSNDPCTIELGNGWRLPTYNEWLNAECFWINWYNAWNSDLKIHAAGEIYHMLGNRGVLGLYYSSKQSNILRGHILYIGSYNCSVPSIEKQDGLPLRCLKD